MLNKKSVSRHLAFILVLILFELVAYGTTTADLRSNNSDSNKNDGKKLLHFPPRARVVGHDQLLFSGSIARFSHCLFLSQIP